VNGVKRGSGLVWHFPYGTGKLPVGVRGTGKSEGIMHRREAVDM